MKAEELIKKTVLKKYRHKSHVRGIIDGKSWWHVHRDEDVPEDYPVLVCVRPIKEIE